MRLWLHNAVVGSLNVLLRAAFVAAGTSLLLAAACFAARLWLRDLETPFGFDLAARLFGAAAVAFAGGYLFYGIGRWLR